MDLEMKRIRGFKAFFSQDRENAKALKTAFFTFIDLSVKNTLKSHLFNKCFHAIMWKNIRKQMEHLRNFRRPDNVKIHTSAGTAANSGIEL